MVNNSKENVFARDKAIKYIGISKKTEFEVRKKLKGLKVTSLVLDEEVEYLKELGFIDDNDYTKSYIRQCEKMPKYSLYEITNKLLQKGINSDIIDEYIETLKESDYESKLIDKLLNGKLKDYDEMKRKSYLYRRGFKF